MIFCRLKLILLSVEHINNQIIIINIISKPIKCMDCDRKKGGALTIILTIQTKTKGPLALTVT